MRRIPHRYRYWGLGHMSHPEDPTTCCELPEDHPIHHHANDCTCPDCYSAAMTGGR